MEGRLTELFLPHPLVLLLAVAADLALGDPVYRLHPVRIIGRMLSAIEQALRRAGADGYGGGIVLLLVLATISMAGVIAIVSIAAAVNRLFGWLMHAFFVYSLLALGDLIHHVRRVDRALLANDLGSARRHIGSLVGRDVDPMDAAACRRAAIESLSENLTDGFVSPVLWYGVAGLPGIVLFKVVSTMDSMVGYKTPAYLRFGWCGARLDDLMNYLPARLTWLLIASVAAILPFCSGRKAFRVGLSQHGILPGPNSGWSETATAGGIERRLAGPIWMNHQLVTDLWIGDPEDPPGATHEDLMRAIYLTTTAGLAAVAIAALALSRLN